MIKCQRQLIWFSLILLFSACSTLTAQNLKGMYVNDFKYILGDSSKEIHLLEFAKEEGFNYLLLYNLREISEDLYDLKVLETAKVLAEFIRKAKEDYHIDAVGAVGQKFSSFKDIEFYNQFWSVGDARRIDVYHMEFEFWNQNFLESEWESTNEALAFAYYMDQLQQLKNSCAQQKIKCETYMGNVSTSQCEAIGALVDRVIVHYYRTSDVYNNGNSIYQYKPYRLPALAASEDKVLEVMPVFSARSYAMGPWLGEHDLEQAFDTFLFGQNAYHSQEGAWKNNINIVGYSWYRYTDLETILNVSTISEEVATSNYQVDQQAYEEINNGNLYERDKEAVSWLQEQNAKRGQALNIYPQPADQQVLIASNMEIKAVQVFDALGKQLRHIVSENETNRISINTADWKAGIYFVCIKHHDNTTLAQKLLVKH